MDFTFAFADKEDLSPILPDIFSILYGNMNAIAPTGSTREEDFAVWRQYLSPP